MSICDTSTCFKNVNSITEDFLLNIVESNFKYFLDWSFLHIGAWINVVEDQSSIYGGHPRSKMSHVEDPSYDTGTVWQGFRKDWVWEHPITYYNNTPLLVNTIKINDTPYNSGFTVNYPEGKIILANPISINSDVRVNYSYKYVQIYRAVDSPWFSVIQYESLNTQNPDIIRQADGDWYIGSEHRMQLPAVVIESIPRSRSKPYEIGNSLLVTEQDIVFHILAENKNDRNKLMDIIRLQQDATIGLFNTNDVAQNNKYPVNYDGTINSSGLMYPVLIDQFLWKKCWLKNIILYDIDTPHPNLHRGLVRCTLEIING
jgi:hypothetical protein